MTRHLIHVGYPKAGSKFLQAWFQLHPELRYTARGLGGFHDVYDVARVPERSYRYFVTSCEDLASPYQGTGGHSFEDAGKPGAIPERIQDAQAAVCGTLKTLYPDATILIVTRGFREMALSGYSQYVRAGGVLHLEAMCRDFMEKLGDDAPHQFDFDYLTGLYREAFGAENVIILPYELLRDDRAGFVRALEERLGLDHRELDVGRLNTSLTPEELYWYPVISRAVLAASSRLGRARSRRMYGWYARRTFDARLGRVVRILSALKPGRKITGADFPEAFLASCYGKAETLRDHPLFARYAAEYLWEDAPAGAREVARLTTPAAACR